MLFNPSGGYMKTIPYKALLSLIFTLVLLSCGNIPSTKNLDNDIAELNKKIEETDNEAEKYADGLLKILIDVKKGVLTNTKVMLEQKRSGIKRFIPLTYKIDGKKYVPPSNKNELLDSIQEDLDSLKKKAKKLRNESAQYTGGLLKIMIETQLATTNNSITALEQKKLFLKHDIPLYAIIHTSESIKHEPEFKETPGADIDKF